MYAYVRARPAADDWYEIDVPPAIIHALATGDQFGLMLTDEKGQTRTRHALSSRETATPPVLIVEAGPGAARAPGAVHSLKTGRGTIGSTIAEARALGRTTLRPGAIVLRFGGAGGVHYDLRLSERPIDAANFEAATRVPRYQMDPLAPKTNPLATANSLRDEVNAVVEDLKPGSVYYFAVRASLPAGDAGPVSALGRYRAFQREYPTLPDKPAGSLAGGHPDPAAGNVWALPELLKINPRTGALLEQTDFPDPRARNTVWDGATVRLTWSPQ